MAAMTKIPLILPGAGYFLRRVKAPDAHKVQLHPGGDGLGKEKLDMAKGDDGFWTVTTAPAVPGFHYYWFLVDGTMTMDPGSETFFGYGRPTSGVEIPEPGVDWYDVKDVPHGEVRARWYRSTVTAAWRRVMASSVAMTTQVSVSRVP